MAKPKRPRVQVPLTDLESELGVQLRLLEKSCNEFDAGDRDEYRRIAVTVRVLVYDGGMSHSLAGQLNLKSVSFVAHGGIISPTNLLPSWPLAIVRTGPTDARLLPSLAEGPFAPRTLDFESWWTEEVFRSPQTGDVLDRQGFVLHTANQAGGAHVDPAIDAVFANIARNNPTGLIATVGGKNFPLLDLEKVYVRHIGFEVLETLKPHWRTITGNRACACGSGRKNRYCCGKLAQDGSTAP